jgi:hypothetical protein
VCTSFNHTVTRKLSGVFVRFSSPLQLPIYNPSDDVNPDLLIVRFNTLANTIQLLIRLQPKRKTITQKIMRKIYVADFFFLLAPLFVPK